MSISTKIKYIKTKTIYINDEEYNDNILESIPFLYISYQVSMTYKD